MNLPGSHFPTIMVIFGATGDLMTKKIAPALLELFVADRLPKLFTVIGVSRRSWSNEDFQAHVRTIVSAAAENLRLDDNRLERFLRIFRFESVHFDRPADYTMLAEHLGAIDGEWKTCANKLFYLAVAPDFYKTIIQELHRSHLTDPCNPEEGWTRVIVEKPFGKDLKSAEELELLLAKLFKEEQIYRIDHYLAKEMIQNILTFRFSNDLFENSWNRDTIERIEFRVWETLGVEERGAFYDGVGALRDVGQNHLLQMLAFATMNEPDRLDARGIRQSRSEMLATLRPIDKKDMARQTFRAQYDGYKTIKDVDPNSSTETYFKILCYLDHPRWQGVPFMLESGKRMGKRQKEIIVHFKHVEPCFCPTEGPHLENRVLFHMEPEEGISIEFWSKKPGLEVELEKRSFDFTLRREAHKKQYVEEYKKLLLDCILGDQTLFVSTEEMRAMWNFVDPIVRAWEKNAVPLATYMPDNPGDAITFNPVPEKDTLKPSLKKEIGLVGLGKMGANLARRLHDKGWRVVAYNRTYEVAEELEREGVVEAVRTLSEFKDKLAPERVVWVMVPSGAAVDEMFFGKEGLAHVLEKGDVVIDGGNSFYKDDAPRAKKLAKKGIRFMDVGTSGGPSGARHGACLMIGGDEKTFTKLEPLFQDIALNEGYQFFPGAGAGHFVKMVHNGIEYGMMQAIAEGFGILKKSRFKLDVANVARIYNTGSVIASRLVGWVMSGFKRHGVDLKKVSSTIAHTGEGAWTVEEAERLGVDAPIIKGSLQFRKQSAKKPSFTAKVVAMLRGEFGGHSTK